MVRPFPAEQSHLNSLNNRNPDRPVSLVSSNDRMRPTTPPPPISFGRGAETATRRREIGAAIVAALSYKREKNSDKTRKVVKA